MAGGGAPLPRAGGLREWESVMPEWVVRPESAKGVTAPAGSVTPFADSGRATP